MVRRRESTVLTSAQATDDGRTRDHNEDYYVARPDLGLWLVADGMGGHAAGEVASTIAGEVVPVQIAAGADLVTAVEAAHQAILAAGQKGRGSVGMGCTLVALLCRGLSYEIAWVGDSRAYLWNGQSLRQLTRDHSYVQQLIDAGVLTPDEARNHPQRSVISQALGVDEHSGIRVDTLSGRWNADEQLLLCSDGLSGEVDDVELAQLLAAGGTEQDKVQALLAAANHNGGSDNITLVLVSAPPEATQAAAKGGTRPFDAAALNQSLTHKAGRNWAIWLIVTLLLGFALWSGWQNNNPAPSVTPGGGGSAQISTPVPTGEKTAPGGNPGAPTPSPKLPLLAAPGHLSAPLPEQTSSSPRLDQPHPEPDSPLKSTLDDKP